MPARKRTRPSPPHIARWASVTEVTVEADVAGELGIFIEMDLSRTTAAGPVERLQVILDGEAGLRLAVLLAARAVELRSAAAPAVERLL